MPPPSAHSDDAEAGSSPASPRARVPPNRGPALRRLAIDYGLLILLAGMAIVFSVAQPAFLRIDNLCSILQAVAIVSLLGVGVTVTMIAGGFDLSIGGVAAIVQMAAAYNLVVLNGSTGGTILLCLLLGVAIGLSNAALIVWLGIPDLLATLGMLFLLGGLQLIPTGGRSIAPGMILLDGSTAEGAFTGAFLALGRQRVWDVLPVPVVVLAIVAAALWFVMDATRFGRVFYAVGGNELAARLAGAPTRLYRVWACVIASTVASVGGLLLGARIGRGDVSAGNGLMLDAIAAALIGYAVLGAKRPNILGTIVGALFVGVLLNGLTMLNAPYYVQDFVKGAVLIGALTVTYGLSPGRPR